MNRIATLLAVAALAIACGGDGGSKGADPGESVARADQVSVVLGTALSSLAFLEESTVLDSINSALPGSDTTSAVANLTEAEAEDLAAEIEEFLTTVVFTEDNYEGGGYYLLSGDDLCDEFDSECQSDLELVELRVRAVEVGDTGLDISIHVGGAKHQLIAFELREDSLGVVLNLGTAADGIEFLAETFGDSIELPEVFEGTIAATVTIDGPDAATFEFALRTGVALSVDLPEGGGTLALVAAAADPVFSMSADGVAETLSAALDMGSLSLSVPYSAISDFSSNPTPLVIELAGLSGSVSLSEGDAELTIEDIAWGDEASTLSLGSAVLFSFLHNDELGPMSVTVAADDPEQPTLAFEPGMTLSIGTHFEPLVAEGEDIPDYLLDETYSVELTGSAPTVQGVPDTLDTSGGLKITGGSLVLATDSDGTATVTVDDGECLLENPAPPVDGHPILGELMSGVCP